MKWYVLVYDFINVICFCSFSTFDILLKLSRRLLFLKSIYINKLLTVLKNRHHKKHKEKTIKFQLDEKK